MSSTVTWSDLVVGSMKETQSSIWWNGLVMVVLCGLVLGIFLMMKRQNNSRMPSKAVREEKWYGIESDPVMSVVPDVPVTLDDHTVKPKSNGSNSKFWEQGDVLVSEIPVAEDPEAAFSYSKFQQALLSGVERKVERQSAVKVNNMKDLESWNEQLGPLRDMLTRSGKSLEQFIDENDVTLPEEILEMWESVKHMKSTQAREPIVLSNVSAEEAASLVKDSIQPVPTANVDFASSIMREILHARTEAAALNIQMPELSNEQKRTLEFWRVSGQMPAADLANKLLSR